MRLRRSKFESWLKAKPPAEIVGNQRDCNSCPVANFYHDVSGGCEIVIFDDGYGGHIIDRGYSRRPLPLWAESFVFLIDADVEGKITAGHSLKILAALTPAKCGGK